MTISKHLIALDRLLNLSRYHIKELATREEMQQDLELMMTEVQSLMETLRNARMCTWPASEGDQERMGKILPRLQRPAIYVFDEI